MGVNRFISGRGPVYRCRKCGRLTRETGNNESNWEMCRFCLAECDNDNELSDGVITQAEFDANLAKIQAERKSSGQ